MDEVSSHVRSDLPFIRRQGRGAVALGSEVIWLHCYGKRFANPAAGQPQQSPRLPKGSAPTVPAGGTIPSAPEPLPDTMDYDPVTQRLKIGKGYIENVTPEMWAYEVSGKEVLCHWFSYRRRGRGCPIIGDRRQPSLLDSIQPDHRLVSMAQLGTTPLPETPIRTIDVALSKRYARNDPSIPRTYSMGSAKV
jgi:Type ISP C-terminal specificity domain